MDQQEREKVLAYLRELKDKVNCAGRTITHVFTRKDRIDVEGKTYEAKDFEEFREHGFPVWEPYMQG